GGEGCACGDCGGGPPGRRVVRGSSRGSALPVNGPRGARFSGWAEPRVHSRPFSQTLAVLAFLSASPPVLLSALQCADGSAPPCPASARPPHSLGAPSVAQLSPDSP